MAVLGSDLRAAVCFLFHLLLGATLVVPSGSAGFSRRVLRGFPSFSALLGNGATLGRIGARDYCRCTRSNRGHLSRFERSRRVRRCCARRRADRVILPQYRSRGLSVYFIRDAFVVAFIPVRRGIY